MTQKCRVGVHPRNPHSTSHDEELIVYVSGDLQASTENSWVWQGSETALDQALGPSVLDFSKGPNCLNVLGPSSATALSVIEKDNWGGWERVERLVQILMWESLGHFVPLENTQNQNQGYHQLSLPAVSRPESGSRTSDRISIANII